MLKNKWKASAGSREDRIRQDTDLKEHILDIHRLRPYFGYKRIRTALHKEGFRVNHKRYHFPFRPRISIHHEILQQS
ncbi:IS3 family transposase [Brevibacillus reuszeri]|uniref:IS3 family transposase n=1 Tax=Brevibacillus reuszeri TaxID=54915 RepID=UPI00366EEB12